MTFPHWNLGCLGCSATAKSFHFLEQWFISFVRWNSSKAIPWSWFFLHSLQSRLISMAFWFLMIQSPQDCRLHIMTVKRQIVWSHFKSFKKTIVFLNPFRASFGPSPKQQDHDLVENGITNHAETSQRLKNSHVTFRRFKVIIFFLQIFDGAEPLPHNSESFSAKFFAPVCRTQSSGKLFISEVVIK